MIIKFKNYIKEKLKLLENKLDSIKNIISAIALCLSCFAFAISLKSFYISSDIYKSTMLGSEFSFSARTRSISDKLFGKSFYLPDLSDRYDEYDDFLKTLEFCITENILEEYIIDAGDDVNNLLDYKRVKYRSIDYNLTNSIEMFIENKGKIPIKNLVIDIEFENIIFQNVKENSDWKLVGHSDNRLQWTSGDNRLFYPKLLENIVLKFEDVGDFYMNKEEDGVMNIKISGENCIFKEFKIPVKSCKEKH